MASRKIISTWKRGNEIFYSKAYRKREYLEQYFNKIIYWSCLKKYEDDLTAWLETSQKKIMARGSIQNKLECLIAFNTMDKSLDPY